MSRLAPNPAARASKPCDLCRAITDESLRGVWHVEICDACLARWNLECVLPPEDLRPFGEPDPRDDRRAWYQLATEVWLQSARLKIPRAVPAPPRPSNGPLRRSWAGSLHRVDGLCCRGQHCLKSAL